MDGFLTKCGRKFGLWKTRYYKLLEDRLAYYEGKQDVLRGAYPLVSIRLLEEAAGTDLILVSVPTALGTIFEAFSWLAV